MADTIDNKWRAHPVLSRAVRVAVVVIPFVTAMAVAFVLSSRLPLADSTAMGAARWVLIIAMSTLAMTIVDRLARRLLPLSTLLNLTLLFPDQAPSRFRVAMRTGTTKQLRQKLDAAQSAALDETPAQAAERLLELVGLLSQHDRLTRGHSERVRAYTHLIGEEMGLTETELDKIRWAGLLHDVGKTVVATEILNKPGRLTDDEFEQIKLHPMAGRELVAPLADWLGESLRAVWEHHERFDGRGYPQGLAGTEISIAARIVSVADAYDVMTSARSYKKAMSATAARAELAANSGSQFDPIVVRAFLNISLGRLRLMTGPVAWVAQLALFEPTGVVHAGQASTNSAAGGAGAAGSAGSGVAASAGASTGVSAVAAKSGIAVGATASTGAATAGAVGASGFAASTAAVAVGVAAGAAGFAVAEPPAPVEFAETAVASDDVVNVVELDDPSSMEIDLATGQLRRIDASEGEATPDAAIDGTADGGLLSKQLSLSPDTGADPALDETSGDDQSEPDASTLDQTADETAGGETADDETADDETADDETAGTDASAPTTEPVRDDSDGAQTATTSPTSDPVSTDPVSTTPTTVVTPSAPVTTVAPAGTPAGPTTTSTTTTTVPPTTSTTSTTSTTTTTTTTTTTVPEQVESDRVYLGALLGVDSIQLAMHALSEGPPPSVALPNYDTNKDGAPGRLVVESDDGIGGSDPDEVVVFTAWRSADITGQVHLELYAAAKDLERSDVTIEAGLYRCRPFSSCVLLDSDTVEYKNADSFKKKKFHFHDAATELNFGDRIEVRVAVEDDSEADAWIAFGTADYDSHLEFKGPRD